MKGEQSCWKSKSISFLQLKVEVCIVDLEEMGRGWEEGGGDEGDEYGGEEAEIEGGSEGDERVVMR